jgi:hypothetical protein
MFQAIVTKYIGPTNFRGSRVKATCQAGSLTIPWDDALNADGNHRAACNALRMKLNWTERGPHKLVGGALPDGKSYAFVEVY